mgnify:CR=1 FL=1
MTIFLGIVSFISIFIISLVHFYWALGGRKWANIVFPQFSGTDKPVFSAGNGATVLVAFIFLSFSGLVFLKTFPVVFRFSSHWIDLGIWMVAGLFLLRAIGEFKYVGFTKTIRDTTFAHYDTKIFTPLSLAIGLMVASIALF